MKQKVNLKNVATVLLSTAMMLSFSVTAFLPEVNGSNAAPVHAEGQVEADAVNITSAGGSLVTGTYTLSSDLKLETEDLMIPADNDVTIDLNGYTLTGTGNGSVITVNGTLTIINSSGNGMITGGSGNTVGSEQLGGGIYVSSTGTLSLKSGAISGNTALRGGGVYAEKNAKLSMSGGEISHNTSTAVKSAGGGGICLIGDNKGRATFDMTGGEISSNKSGIQGGGVFTSGIMTLSGGSISNNQAPAGGGIMANYIFTMTGGVISGNIASGGQDNIKNGGTFGHALGGGVKTINEFYLYGGKIINNKVINDDAINESTGVKYMYNGAGIHANWQSGGVHVKGSPIVSGNTNENLDGSSLADNIYFQYTENKADVVLHLDGDLNSDAVLPIGKGGDLSFGWVVAGHGYSFDSKSIYSENDKVFGQNGSDIYYGEYPTGTVIGYVKEGDKEVPCSSFEEFFMLTKKQGTLYIRNDLVLEKMIELPKGLDVTFVADNENGVKITGLDALTNFFFIPANSSLTLLRKFTLTGNAKSSYAFDVDGTLNLGAKDNLEEYPVVQGFTGYNGNAINVSAGTVNIYNAHLINNQVDVANKMGGAIYATNHSTVNFYQGVMSGNTVTSYGGAICLNNSTLNMFGGSITGNSSGNVGSGVHLFNTSFLNMYGGSISGNFHNGKDANQVSLNTSCAMIVDGTVGSFAFASANAYAFYTNGGVFENSTIPTEFPIVTREGHTFEYWSNSASLETEETSLVKGCHYAKWTKVDNYFDDIASYRGSEGYTAPIKEGQVFAGWYSDAEYTTPIGKDVTSGPAYAKFVDAKVMDVKVQITAGTTADSTITNMRIVSTVDSLMYRDAGFIITITKTTQISCRNVYTKIVAKDGGVAFSYEPTYFSSSSKYFTTYTIKNIPNDNFGTEIKITPYWVTMDGTMVKGSEVIKTVNDCLNVK